MLRKSCAPIWFYLQDYTEMHRQQNIKKKLSLRLHHFQISSTTPLKASKLVDAIILCQTWKEPAKVKGNPEGLSN